MMAAEPWTTSAQQQDAAAAPSSRQTTSVRAMRPGDVLWWVAPSASSLAMAWSHHWLATLVILAVTSVLSVIVWDIRRANGVGAWILTLLQPFEAVFDLLDQRRKQRQKRRVERLRERQRRRPIKRRDRPPR